MSELAWPDWPAVEAAFASDEGRGAAAAMANLDAPTDICHYEVPEPAGPGARSRPDHPPESPDVIVERRQDPVSVDRILRALPDWFGIESAIVDYVAAAAVKPGYCAVVDGRTVGIALVERHYHESAELYLIAVDPEFRGRGVGRALVQAIEYELRADGVRLLQVKTVGESFEDASYAQTRAFYAALGFQPHRGVPRPGLVWPDAGPGKTAGLTALAARAITAPGWPDVVPWRPNAQQPPAVAEVAEQQHQVPPPRHVRLVSRCSENCTTTCGLLGTNARPAELRKFQGCGSHDDQRFLAGRSSGEPARLSQQAGRRADS